MISLLMVILSQVTGGGASPTTMTNKSLHFGPSALPPHTSVTLLTEVTCKNRADVETSVSVVPCYLNVNRESRLGHMKQAKLSRSYKSKSKQFIDIKIRIDEELKVSVDEIKLSYPDSEMQACMMKELENGRQILNFKLLGNCAIHQKLGLSPVDNDQDLIALERKVNPPRQESE